MHRRIAVLASALSAASLPACESVPDITFGELDAAQRDSASPIDGNADAAEDVILLDGEPGEESTCGNAGAPCSTDKDCCSGHCLNDKGTHACG